MPGCTDSIGTVNFAMDMLGKAGRLTLPGLDRDDFVVDT